MPSISNSISRGPGHQQRLHTGQNSRWLPSARLAPCSRLPCRVLASTALQEQPVADAAVDAAPGAVISPLVGKKLLQLNLQQCAVPLLHPIAHQLPFATSLQIYSSSNSSRGTAASQGSSDLQVQPQPNSSLVELHYVISGHGHFTSSSTGAQQELWPGDSVIALHGAASFAAGPVPPAAAAGPQHTEHQQQHQQQDQQQHQHTEQQQQSVTAAWVQLSNWLQQLHAKQQPSRQQQEVDAAAAAAAAPTHLGNTNSNNSSSNSSTSSSQLVMLQLLLPAELLTGEMLTHHQGHCHVVAEQLPWTIHNNSSSNDGSSTGSNGSSFVQHNYSSNSKSLQCVVTPLSSIHEAEVCGLLADAGVTQPTPRRPQAHHQQPEQQPQQQQQQGTVQARQELEQRPASSTAHSSSSSNGNDSDSSSSRAAAPLPRLHQQQILKRALSEVGAFRLPQQTNRLALLFGPHSSPPVSVSFGVEVFEPGHVTPLHIHNTAHELFFVLAGKGEAVFKASSNNSSSDSSDGSDSSSSSSAPQRVRVSPGDVAVFPPGVVHGVDNPSDSQLYCLQMMLPNELFVEWVRSGEEVGRLDVAAVQQLAAAASCG